MNADERGFAPISDFVLYAISKGRGESSMLTTKRVLGRGLLLLCGAMICLGGTARAGYEFVPGWPTLPDGEKWGEVAGVGVDSHNHVFVFHRADPSLALKYSSISLRSSQLYFFGLCGPSSHSTFSWPNFLSSPILYLAIFPEL